MRAQRRLRAVCCTCGRMGPRRRTKRGAVLATLYLGWEWGLGLGRCLRCVGRGLLPDVEIGLGPIAAAGVRIYPDEPTLN